MGRAFKHFAARNFYLGDQMNAWFDQNCFVNKADTMPGEDAVSAGYDFSPRGRKDKKLVAELEDLFNSESFNLNETIVETAKRMQEKCAYRLEEMTAFAIDQINIQIKEIEAA
jgi:hypothetical protein